MNFLMVEDLENTKEGQKCSRGAQVFACFLGLDFPLAVVPAQH